MSERIECTNCDYTETLVNGEEISDDDRCPGCGAVGTLKKRY